MSVLTRPALEGSTLADLHVLASELGIDGFRRLRKADLVTEILKQSGSPDEGPTEKPAPVAAPSSDDGRDDDDEDDDDDDVGDTGDDDEEDSDREERPRRRRGGRGRGSGRARGGDGGGSDAGSRGGADAGARGGSRSGGRGGSGRGARDEDDDSGRDDSPPREQRVAEGVVELLGNGSGFLRVSPPEPSDDDVYISAAQVRRCELVSGDTIAGPVRPPRRSERYPSLVRIDTINGRPADEVAEGTPFDQLAAVFPSERFALASEDATLKAIEWLTPIGRGSRVTIVGAPRAGKSETLRRLAGALVALDGVEVLLVLAGVRPEETAPEGLEPVAALSFATSADNRGQAVDRAVDTAKRVAARGGHAVLLIDTLDGLPASVATRALASARALADGGSVTVVATASAPHGGETTVIALDVALTSTGRLPALDLGASGTLHPELLVGDAGADAIASARAAALGV